MSNVQEYLLSLIPNFLSKSVLPTSFEACGPNFGNTFPTLDLYAPSFLNHFVNLKLLLLDRLKCLHREVLVLFQCFGI